MAESPSSVFLYRLLSTAFMSLLFASQFCKLDAASSFEINRDVFVEPKASDKNIFFFEGSCLRNSKRSEQNSKNTSLHLDITQACAVESAARANPDMSVFVFSTCSLDNNSLLNASRMVQEIFERHDNVHIWHQSLKDLFYHTDLEDFFHSGKMFNSPFKTQTSNVVRLLLLQKFGGIYLDLDFIVRRSLSELTPNFAGLQANEILNTAALGVSMDQVGRKVIGMFIKELKQTFNGSVWGHNGPKLATRVMKKLCNFTKVQQDEVPPDMPFSVKDCEGFTIYHQNVFYPIFWRDYLRFYKEERSEQTLAKVENSTAVHLWNSMKDELRIKMYPDLIPGSKQPKIVMQLKYCPIAHSFN